MISWRVKIVAFLSAVAITTAVALSFYPVMKASFNNMVYKISHSQYSSKN